MADPTVSELNELFGAGDKSLGQDVIVEMQSIMRLHNLAPQDLFFKWESYCIKLDIEATQPSYEKMRGFKQDLQDALHWASGGQCAMKDNVGEEEDDNDEENLVVVAGSLYLVADFYRCLQEQ